MMLKSVFGTMPHGAVFGLLNTEHAQKLWSQILQV